MLVKVRTGLGDLECSIGRASMRENRAIKARRVNEDILPVDQKTLIEMQFRCRVHKSGEGLYVFIIVFIFC